MDQDATQLPALTQKITLTPLKAAARRLNISPYSAYGKIKRKEWPAYRLGKKILVDVEEILEVMRVK